jgi:hypothetical protein
MVFITVFLRAANFASPLRTFPQPKRRYDARISEASTPQTAHTSTTCQQQDKGVCRIDGIHPHRNRAYIHSTSGTSLNHAFGLFFRIDCKLDTWF